MVEGTRMAIPPPPLPPSSTPHHKEGPESDEEEEEVLALARASALVGQLLSHPEWAGVRARLVAPVSAAGSPCLGPLALLPMEEGAAMGLATAALGAAMRLSGRRKRHPRRCLALLGALEGEEGRGAGFSGRERGRGNLGPCT